MTENVIRIQLPGGDNFAPALQQAAGKTAARSDLSKAKRKALTDLVEAAVDVLNSGGSSVITLEMDISEGSIAVTATGEKCKSPAKTRVKALASLASKKALSFEQKNTRAATTVHFAV